MEIDQETVKKLIKESQEGNTESFGKIYEHFVDAIYRFVYFKANKNEL